MGHLQHLAALPNRERYKHNTHNQREEYDSDSEVQKGDAIQQDQTVYHRLDDSQVPNVYEYLEYLHEEFVSSSVFQSVIAKSRDG